VAASLAVTASRTAWVVAGTSAYGSSSTPISNSSVSVLLTVGNAARTAGTGEGVTPSGYSSAARRFSHSFADSWVRPRIRENALARSVVLIAPRASSTLKVWLHLST
jgi:hypothetical protein